MHICEIWMIILGLTQAVVKEAFSSTFRAVSIILINITKILKNFLGSNIRV